MGSFRWVACVAFLTLAGGHAEAGQFTFDMTGQTAAGSSFGSAPFSNDLSGMSFDLKAVCESTPIPLGPAGEALFTIDSLIATVGSSTFRISSVTGVAIADPSNPTAPGDYLVEIGFNQAYFGFSGASQPFTVSSIVSTVFQNYVNVNGGSTMTYIDALLGTNTKGTLKIVVDPSVGVNASISVAPEPATILTALVGLAGVGVLRRRRGA